MRSELKPRKPSPRLIKKLTDLANAILDAIDEDKNEDCTLLLLEFAASSGTSGYDRDYFKFLHAHSSVEELVQIASRGAPPDSPDLEGPEAIEIIGLILDDAWPETDYYLKLLENEFPHASITDLIFWPHKDMDRHGIYEEIQTREAIWQAGGDSAIDNYVRELCQSVLSNPDSPISRQYWAQSTLSSLEKKPAPPMSARPEAKTETDAPAESQPFGFHSSRMKPN